MGRSLDRGCKGGRGVPSSPPEAAAWRGDMTAGGEAAVPGATGSRQHATAAFLLRQSEAPAPAAPQHPQSPLQHPPAHHVGILRGNDEGLDAPPAVGLGHGGPQPLELLIHRRRGRGRAGRCRRRHRRHLLPAAAAAAGGCCCGPGRCLRNGVHRSRTNIKAGHEHASEGRQCADSPPPSACRPPLSAAPTLWLAARLRAKFGVRRAVPRRWSDLSSSEERAAAVEAIEEVLGLQRLARCNSALCTAIADRCDGRGAARGHGRAGPCWAPRCLPSMSSPRAALRIIKVTQRIKA